MPWPGMGPGHPGQDLMDREESALPSIPVPAQCGRLGGSSAFLCTGEALLGQKMHFSVPAKIAAPPQIESSFNSS